MLYDTDKSTWHDGSTEGAVWCHCKPASIIIKRLWWLAKVSAESEKACHPYLQEWQERGFRELDLISLTLTLGNVMEKKTLKIISSYFKMVFGSTDLQQRKSCLTNLIASYEEHLTGWGETNGQGPRQPGLGSLLQQGGIGEDVLQMLLPASAILWFCKMHLWHC